MQCSCRNACKCPRNKGSGAKKIGGVETQVSKESPNGKSKNEFENRFDVEYIKKLLKDPEFIKYAKWVLGVSAIGVTHEGLSYFKGKPGQFYEKPAGFSFTGYFRKQEELKLAEEELKKKLMEEKKRKKHEDKMKQLFKNQKKLMRSDELEPIFQKIRNLDPHVILVEEKIFDKSFLTNDLFEKSEIQVMAIEQVCDPPRMKSSHQKFADFRDAFGLLMADV